MELLARSDFHLVATHGGFGRASGQAKATVSRRVRELEESLGVRLIERGSRTRRLREEGAVLHARTGARIGEIAEALQDVKAGLGRPSGRLRISVPLLFAQTSLGSVAAAFLAAFPEVLLEVATDDRFVDLVADEVDVVIRVNPRPDSDLVGRCLLRNWGLSTASATEVWVLHASHRLVSPKVSAFVNFVCDYFGSEARRDLLTQG